MPVINATVPQESSGIGMLLETVLNSAVAYQKGKLDKAYRLSAAKQLGVKPEDIAHFKREKLESMLEEEQKAKRKVKYDYGPEALAFEQAKNEYKNTPKKEYDNKVAAVGLKIANGEKVTKDEADLYTSSGTGRYVPADRITGYVNPKEKSAQGKGTGIGALLKNIIGGLKPPSPAETIGAVGGPVGMGIGKMFNKQPIAPPITPESIAGTEMPQPLPVATPETQSPYPEYPDAFQENGVWKVMRAGKKYRIEE